MTRRLVVHIRYSPTLDPDEPLEERSEGWAKLVTPLVERAIALGGRIVSFAPERLSADFSWDGLYDALDFVVETPEAPELSIGIAAGPIRALQGSSRIVLGVGEAISVASRLAELARPGEVLVEPELVKSTGGAIGTVGEAGKRPGRPNLEALILDSEAPLREVQPNREIAFDSGPASTPAGSEPPMSMTSAAILGMTTESALAEGPLRTAVADALGRRDAQSLAELATTLRAEGTSETTERIDAIVALTKGKTGDALRRLRAAKEGTADSDPSAKARACLALAVALGTAGRNQEAVLEALEGLARAREAEDRRGEVAACRYLGQLAERMGDPISRDRWLEKSA